MYIYPNKEYALQVFMSIVTPLKCGSPVSPALFIDWFSYKPDHDHPQLI